MPTTTDISKSIRGASGRLVAIFTQNGWNKTIPIHQVLGYNAPSVSVDFISLWADAVAARLSQLTRREMDEGELGNLLTKSLPLFDGAHFGNIQQDPDGVIGGFTTLLCAIDSRMPPLPAPAPPPPQVDWEDLKDEKALLPKDLARRLRSIASQLNTMEPKAADLARMIEGIVSAHQTAEELPTDIEDLRVKKEEVRELAEQARLFSDDAEKASGKANDAVREIDEVTERATGLATQSERALRGATGVGLASAFEARKKALSWAGVCWTLGLIAALFAGLVIGWDRVTTLKDVLQGNKSASVIWANVVLAIVGVGGPIWFAWLATKQIGSAFRLAEDYAFKATVSKAYEGYRKEALDLDPELRARLFASALDRFEEAPIRLIDPAQHSSPLQEALNNPALIRTLEKVPGFTEKLVALIPTKGGTAVVAPAAAAAALVSAAGTGRSESEEEA